MAWSPARSGFVVVGYGVYLGQTRVATVTELQYAFDGLSCGTSYVLGVDAVNSRGVRSSLATVNASTSPCPDASPPGMPTGLAPTDAKQTTITLSWVAATDNVGVAGYDLFKDNTSSATTPGTSFTFTALDCGRSYALGVVSFDAAGNRSSRATVTASTSACPDTFAPTPPGNLQKTNATVGSLALSWTASADDTAVAGYGLYLNGVNVGTVPWLSYLFSGLACGTSYVLGVDSFDSAGNRSAIVTMSAATSACSAPPPVSTPPTNTASPIVIGQTTIGSTLSAGPGTWTGTSPMTYAHQWSRCDLAGASCAAIAGATAAGYTLTLSDVGARLRVAVTATNVAGSSTANSALTAAVSNPTSDTSPPNAPTNLAKVGATTTSVSVSWTASSDNLAVAGYGAYRNGTLLGSVAQTSYTVNGLSCGTSYTVAVDAYDAAGNRSERASLLTATNPCPSGLWQPAPGTTWQWQITGRVDETVGAQMFDVDMTDASPGGENAGIVDRLHGRGIIAICYLDTGAWESYRPDAGEFPASVIGNSTGWSGERWLDIRAAAWPQFASIIWKRLDLAKSLGCDGVEPDQNNPVGNNPGFPISLADQKAWYLEVARQAHLRGLSVGMKNGIETVDATTVSAFDWALNEECFQYNECGVMSQFISAGKAVFQTEYLGLNTSFCPQANSLYFSSMKKKLSLDAWRETCW